MISLTQSSVMFVTIDESTSRLNASRIDLVGKDDFGRPLDALFYRSH